MPAGQWQVDELEDPYKPFLMYPQAAGETVPLDASQSYDPDMDPLRFSWTYYPEAGTWSGAVQVANPDESVAEFVVPSDARGKQIHIILDVTDESGIVPLTSYRRIVVDVE